MPRKDPVTGCNVMTLHEFVEDAAKKEGISADEYIGNVFDEMNGDERIAENDISENIFEHSFRLVSIANDGVDKEDWYPLPVTHIKTVSVKVSYKIASTKNEIVAVFTADDGNTYLYTITESCYFGSMMEPPDNDVSVKIVKQ